MTVFFHSSGMMPALLREGTFEGVVELLLPDDMSGGNGGLQPINGRKKKEPMSSFDISIQG
jgi:hypothetical protein